MQFNKVSNPIYTAIQNYSFSEDGSISAKYTVGTGNDQDGTITDFIPICETYKHIESDVVQSLINKPLSTEDNGKSPNEIIVNRIYQYLKEIGEIVV